MMKNMIFRSGTNYKYLQGQFIKRLVDGQKKHGKSEYFYNIILVQLNFCKIMQ